MRRQRNTLSEMSLVEEASVAPKGRENYGRLLRDFLFRTALTSLLVDPTVLDAALVQFFDRLYLEGRGANVGRKLLSAIMFFVPQYASQGRASLPRASRGLRGWDKLMPASTRRPLPWCVVCAIALYLSACPSMMLCWLLMVDCYFRPSELVEMVCSQVIRAQQGRGMTSTAFHVNPDYLGKASKTGELDESLLVGRPWLGKALERYLAQRVSGPLGKGQRLWSFGLPELRSAFVAAAHKAGIAFLRPVLYMGRHTGASLDRLEGRRTLDEVQKRGRWRSTNSVRRYEKHALVQEVLERMHPTKVAYCQQCEPKLREMLERLW